MAKGINTKQSMIIKIKQFFILLWYKIYGFLYTVFFHRKIIAGLEKELVEPFELKIEKYTQFYNDGITEEKGVVNSPMLSIFAAHVTELFRRHPDAKNYLSFKLIDRKTNEPFEILLRRYYTGLDPLGLNAELKKENAELKQEIEKLKNEKKPRTTIKKK